MLASGGFPPPSPKSVVYLIYNDTLELRAYHLLLWVTRSLESIPLTPTPSYHVPVLCKDHHHLQQELHRGGLLMLEPVCQDVESGFICYGRHPWAPEQLAKEDQEN